jgi:hypothetical protein
MVSKINALYITATTHVSSNALQSAVHDVSATHRLPPGASALIHSFAEFS